MVGGGRERGVRWRGVVTRINPYPLPETPHSGNRPERGGDLSRAACSAPRGVIPAANDVTNERFITGSAPRTQTPTLRYE